MDLIVLEVRAGSVVRLQGAAQWSVFVADGLFTVEVSCTNPAARTSMEH